MFSYEIKNEIYFLSTSKNNENIKLVSLVSFHLSILNIIGLILIFDFLNLDFISYIRGKFKPLIIIISFKQFLKKRFAYYSWQEVANFYPLKYREDNILKFPKLEKEKTIYCCIVLFSCLFKGVPTFFGYIIKERFKKQ